MGDECRVSPLFSVLQRHLHQTLQKLIRKGRLDEEALARKLAEELRKDQALQEFGLLADKEVLQNYGTFLLDTLGAPAEDWILQLLLGWLGAFCAWHESPLDSLASLCVAHHKHGPRLVRLYAVLRLCRHLFGERPASLDSLGSLEARAMRSDLEELSLDALEEGLWQHLRRKLEGDLQEWLQLHAQAERHLTARASRARLQAMSLCAFLAGCDVDRSVLAELVAREGRELGSIFEHLGDAHAAFVRNLVCSTLQPGGVQVSEMQEQLVAGIRDGWQVADTKIPDELGIWILSKCPTVANCLQSIEQTYVPFYAPSRGEGCRRFIRIEVGGRRVRSCTRRCQAGRFDLRMEGIVRRGRTDWSLHAALPPGWFIP